MQTICPECGISFKHESVQLRGHVDGICETCVGKRLLALTDPDPEDSFEFQASEQNTADNMAMLHNAGLHSHHGESVQWDDDVNPDSAETDWEEYERWCKHINRDIIRGWDFIDPHNDHADLVHGVDY